MSYETETLRNECTKYKASIAVFLGILIGTKILDHAVLSP